MKRRKGFLIEICVILAVLLGFSMITANFARDYRDTAGQQLEAALRRSAVACYGAEGYYPPDVAYLQTHYGITYDENQFIVHYDLFASNVMPEISVLKK